MAIRIYFSEDGPIKVHLNRVSPCLAGFPAGYYWYGGNKQGPGRPSKWLGCLLQEDRQKLDAELQVTKEQINLEHKESRLEDQQVHSNDQALEQFLMLKFLNPSQ